MTPANSNQAEVRPGRFAIVGTTLLVVIGAALGFAMIMGQPRLLTDEGAHASQVWLFSDGKSEILVGITMIPGYHAILALVNRAAGFALYMGTYANTHEYNREELRFYVHNEGLYWLTHYTWIRAAAFVPMAWMALTVCVIDLAQPRLRIMYLVAPLSVGLHPLIEQRYYLPALTLFQVWRPTAGGRWENAMLVIYAVLSIVMVWGTATNRFFS